MTVRSTPGRRELVNECVFHRFSDATATSRDSGQAAKAAIAAWPMLMPPSLAGIAACTSTSSPARSRPSRHLGQPRVLEHAAGEDDRVEAVRRAADAPTASVGGRPGRAPRGSRPRSAAGRRPRRRSASSAATSGAGSSTSSRDVACRRSMRPVVARRVARSTVRASASSSIAACAS